MAYAKGTASVPLPVPTSASFHTESKVEFAALFGALHFTALDALIDLGYQLPPTKAEDGKYQFAQYASKLVILDSTVFDYSGTKTFLQSAYDFEWFKKEKKWVLFKTTVDVEGIPVTFKAGAEGELGLSGTADLTFDDADFNASLEASIGPHASLSAFGEASVYLVVASVGVGVDLGLLELSPRFEPTVKTYAARATSGGAPRANAGVELGVALPLEIRSGWGDFYVFAKILGIGPKHKKPVVTWDGYRTSVDLISPLTFFVGPVGEFFVTSAEGSTTSGAIHQAAAVTGGTSWIGDVSLEAGSYTFHYQNVDAVKLTSSRGAEVFSAGASCGGATIATRQVEIPSGGTYTLQASVSDCARATADNPSRVWWTQDGQAGAVGYSGTAGYGVSTGLASGGLGAAVGSVQPGSAACGVTTWLFNGPLTAPGASPALYRCAGTFDLQFPYADPVSTAPPVNAPSQGLWVQQAVPLPLGISSSGLAVMVQANPAQADAACGTVQDSLRLSLTNGSTFTQAWAGAVDPATGAGRWLVPANAAVAAQLPA